MKERNISDVVTGVVVSAFGAMVAIYAFNKYNLGTFQRMGPGMFPVGIGIFISMLGLALSASAWIASAGTPFKLSEIQWRPAFLVLTGVGLFSFLIIKAGLIPAVMSLVAVSAFADERARPLPVLILSIVLCAIAFVIFRLALGMNFRLLDWRF